MCSLISSGLYRKQNMNICTACMNNKVFKVRVTYAYVQNNEESNICTNKGHNKYKAINTL